MKFGVRTPSIKRSIKAKTTGRVKRALKSSVNPLYGKKGMGYINNPKKAVYNKIYNKTTSRAIDLIKSNSQKSNNHTTLFDEAKIYRNFELLNSGASGALIFVSLWPMFISWLAGSFIKLFFPTLGGFIIAIAWIIILADIYLLVRMFYNKYVNNKTLSELSTKLNRRIKEDDISSLEMEMKEYYRIISEHLTLLIQSDNLKEFFYEYTFVCTILKEASKIESAFIISEGLPSEILDNLEKNKNDLINNLIESQFLITKEKIESLKTAKAKINNANLFREKFEEYISELPNECVTKYNESYESLIRSIGEDNI